MSNLVLDGCQSDVIDHPCDSIELLIQPREKDLGGFQVRRVLPYRDRKMIGPWIFFDHMGPAVFPAGQGIDVRPHPHINLATVTYLFEGEILHRDSLGSLQPIQPGAINLMVAGRGITHSERERPEVRGESHTQHGLQLWLALPEADEEMAPDFRHYAPADIPRVVIDGVPVRVMIGSAYNVTAPVITFAETLYLEADMQAGQSLMLPDSVEERAVYVVSGELREGDTIIPEHSMAVLTRRNNIVLTATSGARIALIGGETMTDRHIWWNFVSSRRERIEQAKADWKEGRFPKVVQDEEEFIPLPER
jgi:redox-sensitive bicupin YhaK (pirin superfamily)